MNWNRLKDMKCPGCTADLKPKKTGETLHVCAKKCGFTISDAKLDSIVRSIYAPKQRFHVPTEEENMSALNNDGRDEMTDDFSDSPFLI